MTMAQYMTLSNGKKSMVSAVVESQGPQDSGKFVALNPQGKLSPTVISAVQILSAYADEPLAHHQLVTLYVEDDILKVGVADAELQRPALGFLLNDADNEYVDVYTQGIAGGFSGLLVGESYYLDTNGGVTTTPLIDTGIYQYVGYAVSASELSFVISAPLMIESEASQ